MEYSRGEGPADWEARATFSGVPHPGPGWISIKDEVPLEGDRVEVFNKNKHFVLSPIECIYEHTIHDSTNEFYCVGGDDYEYIRKQDVKFWRRKEGFMSTKVGITERKGDPGRYFEWIPKVGKLPMSIIISKNFTMENKQLIKACIDNADRVIIHVTCTGMGGTKIEPGVPRPELVHECLRQMTASPKFKSGQIVLRLDPIVPTERGLVTAERVLEMMADTGVKRVRYSYMQCYKHVNARLKVHGVELPYGGQFNAPVEMKAAALHMLNRWRMRYEFEACAEGMTGNLVGCISAKDTAVLGIDLKLTGSSGQRRNCRCPENKLELMDSHTKCDNGCLYCYWQ